MCSSDKEGFPRVISLFGVELKAITENDLEMVRQWRNHPDVAQYMLSQEQISTELQVQWFKQLQQRTDSVVFVAFYKNVPLGVANAKALNGLSIMASDDIEPGVYMAPESRYRGTLLAFAPALALNQTLFERTGCKRLVAHVITSNTAAIRFNQTMGYEQIPTEQKDLVRMQLTFDNFLKAKEKIAKVLRF